MFVSLTLSLTDTNRTVVLCMGMRQFIAGGGRLQLTCELPVASAAQRPVVRFSERPVANAMSVL